MLLKINKILLDKNKKGLIEREIRRVIKCVFRMELKAQMRSYVMKNLPTLRDKFQFSWSNDLDLLSNIGKFNLSFLAFHHLIENIF